MKVLRLSAALLLLGSLTLSLADTPTVDEQISAIENATTVEERTDLVNEFKTTLSTLSVEDRAAAVEQLQSVMQDSGLMMQTQTRTQARVQARQGEMMNNADGVISSASSMVSQNIATAGVTPDAAIQNATSKIRGGFGR